MQSSLCIVHRAALTCVNKWKVLHSYMLQQGIILHLEPHKSPGIQMKKYNGPEIKESPGQMNMDVNKLTLSTSPLRLIWQLNQIQVQVFSKNFPDFGWFSRFLRLKIHFYPCSRSFRIILRWFTYWLTAKCSIRMIPK